MFRSVKSQIVFATSLIIILILGATAYFVIDTKIKEVNNDIFVRATSFAELTHERVVTNYENNYKQDVVVLSSQAIKPAAAFQVKPAGQISSQGKMTIASHGSKSGRSGC